VRLLARRGPTYSSLVRVLITGMSGTGKSAVVTELKRRGYSAYDADDDGFTAPDSAGIWRWRLEAVRELFSSPHDDPLFFAGCSDEQREFGWDLKILLTAPESMIVERLKTRSSNTYGKTAAETARVLADMNAVEPLLRQAADVVIDTQLSLEHVTDTVLEVTDLAGAQSHR
jgi:dephospho-CoA kinase